MPSKVVSDVIKKLGEMEKALNKHLEEGVDVKVAIAKVQQDSFWIRILGMVIFAGIAGLYFKG